MSLGVVVRLGESPGAEIVDVVAHGAAASVNLAVGDVINSVDGKPINSPSELAAELSSKAPGAKVEIGYLHLYWQVNTTVILAQ